MNFPNIRKRPWKNIDLMIIGFLDIIHGLISLASLGYWYANPAIYYVIWRTKLMLKQSCKGIIKCTSLKPTNI